MKLQITLKKSPISSLQVHKDTVAALGLRKMNQTVIKEDNPCIRGQIFRVKHMLDVQEIEANAPQKAPAKKAAVKETEAAAVKDAKPAAKKAAAPKKAAKATEEQ